MNLSDVASILQIGFSGFAFLMAGFSFRLLRAEANREGSGRTTILHAVRRYTTYTLVMALLVIVARLGEQALSAYNEREESSRRIEQQLQSVEAEKCRDALSRLVRAETKINPDYPSLLLAVQQGSSNCDNILQRLNE